MFPMTNKLYSIFNRLTTDIGVKKINNRFQFRIPCVHSSSKETQHFLRILAMHEANTALLDVLVDNFVIILSFQNPTKSPFAKRSIDVKSAVRF